ncbi:MAG: hypothetical protein V4719_04175 [Planctomycetota bacterium]
MLESVASIFAAKLKADEVNTQEQFVWLVQSLIANPIGTPNSLSAQEVADTLYQMESTVELLGQALVTFEDSLRMAADLQAEFGAAAEGAIYREAKAQLEQEWQRQQAAHDAEVREYEGKLVSCSQRIQAANVARTGLLMNVTGEVHMQYGKMNQKRDRLHRELSELLDIEAGIALELEAGLAEQNCDGWEGEDDVALAATNRSLEDAKAEVEDKRKEIDDLLTEQRSMLASDAVTQAFTNSRQMTMAS